MKLKRPDLSRDWKTIPDRMEAMKQLQILKVLDDGRRTVRSLAKLYHVSFEEIEYHREQLLKLKLRRRGIHFWWLDMNNSHYRGSAKQKK